MASSLRLRLFRAGRYCRLDVAVQVGPMNLYLIACIVLFIVAFVARSFAKRMDARSGLPAGRLVYSDTGYAVGRLGELVRDEQGRKVERPLLSKQYGLVGRPDYLIETDDGIIPVEVK